MGVAQSDKYYLLFRVLRSISLDLATPHLPHFTWAKNRRLFVTISSYFCGALRLSLVGFKEFEQSNCLWNSISLKLALETLNGRHSIKVQVD